MIIFIILVITAILIPLITYKSINDQYDKIGITIIVSLLPVTLLLVCFIVLPTEHTITYRSDLIEYQNTRKALCTRLTSQNATDDIDRAIKDAYEFNAKIETQRYLHDNPWTSWFYNRAANEVDRIPEEMIQKAENREIIVKN